MLRFGMKRGFTLVELLIVMAILAIMAVIMVGIFNPIVYIQKANDTKRKFDLGSIKNAMELFYQDKKCYPTNPEELMSYGFLTCGASNSYVKNMPCDPTTKKNYMIFTEPVDPTAGMNCPRWYKVLAKLEYLKDKDIFVPPANTSAYIYTGSQGAADVADYNYGVSSSSVSWNDMQINTDLCYLAGNVPGSYTCRVIDSGTCNSSPNGCTGDNCFLANKINANECSPLCHVECCGNCAN